MHKVTKAMQHPRERHSRSPQTPQEGVPHPLPPVRREAAKKEGPDDEEDDEDRRRYTPSQDRVLSRWKGLRNSRPLSKDVDDRRLR
jgi:hypothetical protein